MYEDHDEYGVPFQSKEEYLAWVWELPVNVLRECLFVRVDYGFSYVDKFLVENFKCISSDHERPKGVLLSINIQSFSDVVTNSSSEIFCTITGFYL